MDNHVAETNELNHETIQAAGALIWRQVSQENQVAVILRNRYDDWTLPKGKLQAGENWQQAALREVREETGYQGEITGFAGAISYLVEGQVKVVLFWHMSVSGPPATNLDSEVSHVEWLSVEEALQRLQYPLERAFLEVWKDGKESMA
jgi:8-oxo-dGTP diphosphatase